MPTADFITVKVTKVPGTIGEYTLNGDRTVQAALDVANLSADDYQIRVNGRDADLNTELTNGSTVVLVKKVKGNMPADFITVKVTKVPGTIGEFTLNGDRTVQAALDVAGHTADDYQIRVNGSEASLTTTLNNGDTVVLVKKVKGNC